MEKEFQVVDKEAFEKYVCTNCNKLLNVPPIFCIDRNFQTDKICGRCVHILDNYNSSKCWRQDVYEHLAKCISYPCSNKNFGCNRILLWDEVKDHENVCTFQCTSCPLHYTDLFPGKTCAWMGNVKDLDEHIENCHKDCILNPPVFDWTDSRSNSIFFCHVGSQLVTVVIKYEKDSNYYCMLMINGNDIESQCFRFQLELFDENKNSSIILRRSRLESIGNMLENMKNFDQMLEIDLIKLKEMLKNTKSIFSRFGIVRKNKKEIIQIIGAKDHELLTSAANSSTKIRFPSLDKVMLQKLECPICNEHMIPPIYICGAGHSICSECKTKGSNCPNCHYPVSEARNITLEKLTTKIQYSCRNREIGCPFVSTSETIRQHEGCCEFTEHPCILKCGWKGLRHGIYNHVTESHPQALLTTNATYAHDIMNRTESYRVLYVNGELFRFSIKESVDNSCQFNVQHLGMTEGDPKFRYELQIIDQSPRGLNLKLTDMCQCITENPNMAHAMAVTISWETMKLFIFEARCYCYIINIITI